MFGTGCAMGLYDAFISYSHAKDKPIAAALQSAVQKLGKPWYRRRALRLFRDDTSLSATPHLWPTIEQALGQSGHFLMLASPEAAASKWVNKEVLYWLEYNSVETLLIALTEGELNWDDAGGDFVASDGKGVPLPPALAKKFPTEPKWVDLRPYREGADRTARKRDAKFTELAADFAAAIRGMPKEDLLSQEVRQQRRALRLAVGAAAALLILAVAATAAGILAKQQTLLAEQRSAVFAASTSQKLIDEGSLDYALLLMLDAAHAFNDQSVPDEVRIAFTEALLSRERMVRRKLFPNMQVFETDDALLLFDPARRDLWKLTNSIDLQRLVVGSADDAGIVALRQSPDGKSYIVFRDNLQVERIDAATGNRQRVGTFTAPKPRAGKTYVPHARAVETYVSDLGADSPGWRRGTQITDNGLVVRWFDIQSDKDPQTPADAGGYIQVMDAQTGAVLQGELDDFYEVTRKAPEGGVYGFIVSDEGTRFYRIFAEQDGLRTEPVKLSETDEIKVQFGDCIAGMPKQLQAAVVKDVKDKIGTQGSFDCKKFGSGYLIHTTFPSDTVPSDTFYGLSGQTIDIRDTLYKAVGDMGALDFSWIGWFPPTATLAAQLKTDWLGVLANGDAYVLTGNLDDAESDWIVSLNYRNQGDVTFGRFIGPDELVAIDAKHGWLYEHDYGDRPLEHLLVSPLQKIVGTDTPIPTLHHGTCVGLGLMPLPKSVRMPDGRNIVYNDRASDKNQLEISDGSKQEVVMLDSGDACVEFSDDWKRMLIIRQDSVALYDLQKVIGTGTLDGNVLDIVRVPAVRSAFFVGAEGGELLTTDGTAHVLLWKQDINKKSWTSAEFYKASHGIDYAEPDATGDRIIVIEAVARRADHGLVYSVGAGETWYDLGTDQFDATFADNGDVVVWRGGAWARTFPFLSLAALAALGDKALSPECHPPVPNDYRKSSCWPDSFR